MQKLKSKTTAIAIAIFLMFSMSASMILIPTTSAHSPPYYIISYAYITAAPNPDGVGQTEAISFWIDYPLPGTLLTNGIRRANYNLTITAPDGTTSTQFFANVTDPTGIQSIAYTPTQVGTYNVSFSYPGQYYIWNASNTNYLLGGQSTPAQAAQYAAYDGDFFGPASTQIQFTVQQAPLLTPIASYPLPTAYWTYPIEGQNTYWYTIASNWLSTPYIPGAVAGTHSPGMLQPYGTAPTTAHIMWTDPTEFGGVVGGNMTAVPGEGWYEGSVYNPRFSNPIIMQGMLFFQEPYGNGGSGGNYVAINLQTGQQIWSINASATGVSLVPSFGYIYDYETPNQYGTIPNGLLIATESVSGQGTVWRGYDPQSGVLTTMNVTNVPSGAAAAGPTGEYLKYVLTNYGTATNPNYYLAEWNSSLVFGGGNPDVTTAPLNWYSGTENARLPSCSDWNVSVNLGGSPTGWAVGTYNGGAADNYLVVPGDIVLMVQGTFGTHTGDVATLTTAGGIVYNPYPANITAISLKPNTLGQTLWSQSYQPAPNNLTRTLASWDPSTGVFIFEDKEDFEHEGYSLATGNYLWTSTANTNNFADSWAYQSLDDVSVYQGNLYFGPGYAGTLYCYNDATGAIEWTWGNGGVGNSTNAGLYTSFGVYPLWISTMADGLLYLQGDVHSPNQPLWKGQQMYCINATSGAQLWSIFDYSENMYNGYSPVAAGYLVTFNGYDSQIYCYGQGPSQTIVTAPDVVSPLTTPVVITGTVMDISAGTKQNEQAMDFPNGVPVVSDANESAWMEYVYMQKPEPTNIIGVPVSIDVIDSNGNQRQIGTATTDASGTFALTWMPDIPGDFTVIATFAGSNSYYGSSAETHFAATAAPATPAPTAVPASNLATMPELTIGIAAAVIAIIIAIAIVGLLIIRKKP